MVMLRQAAGSNLAILSGAAGGTVVNEYAAMLRDFSHASWQSLHLKFSRAETFAGSLVLICAAASAWRRLVFYYSLPKFQVLAAGDSGLSSAGRRELVEGLVAQGMECDKCIDPFTQAWLERLSSGSEAIRSKAVASLELHLAATSVCSVRVEKKHLLGQEVRKAKTRGPAPTAMELSKRSYEREVSQVNEKKSKIVEQAVLRGTSRAAVSRLVKSLASNRRNAKDADKAARQQMIAQRRLPNRASAWGEYRRLHWTPAIAACSAEGSEEMARLQGAFSKVGPAELSMLQALADRRTDEERKSHKATLADIDPSSVLTCRRGVVPTRARRLAMRNSLDAIQHHSAWQCGAAIDSYGMPIKPGNIDMATSQSEIRTKAAGTFDMDAEPVQNPAGTALPVRVCGELLGGLCEKHPHFHGADAIVKNLYRVLKARGVNKCSLPIICKLGAADPTDTFYHFALAEMHGKGVNMVVLGLQQLEGGNMVLAGGGSLAFTTLHRLAAKRIVDGSDSIAFTCLEYSVCADATCVMFQIRGERFRQDISTVLVARGRPKQVADEIRLPFGLRIEAAELPVPDDAVSESAGSGDSVEERESGQEESSSCCEEGPEKEEEGENQDPIEPVRVEAIAAPVDPGTEEPPPLPPPDAPQNRPNVPQAGLCGIEIAPSGRAKCCVCGELILKGDRRFNYQARASRTLSDFKRVHTFCVPRLPPATRLADNVCCFGFARSPTSHERITSSLRIWQESCALMQQLLHLVRCRIKMKV